MVEWIRAAGRRSGLLLLDRFAIKDWSARVSPIGAPSHGFGADRALRSTTKRSLGLQLDNKENARLNAFLPRLNRHGRGSR